MINEAYSDIPRSFGNVSIYFVFSVDSFDLAVFCCFNRTEKYNVVLGRFITWINILHYISTTNGAKGKSCLNVN